MKIAVLTHEKGNFENINYLLRFLMEVWGKSNSEVVIFNGTHHFDAADVLFLHVDLTVIPLNYLSFSKRFPVVINGGVHDISKRKVSSNLIRKYDPYMGEVIVKTDRNCGGVPEKNISKDSEVHRFLRRLGKHLPWSWSGFLPSDGYPIYGTPRQVPLAVWWNPNLIVEKYLPEREGKYYCLRQWVFLGDREINQRLISTIPIVKSKNVVSREYDPQVPESLRTLRTQLGFDYGKFDYVLVNGEAILLDANRTPAFSSRDLSPRQIDMVVELAKGLTVFIDPANRGFARKLP